MKPNTVWGYNWENEIQRRCRAEGKLLRVAAAIPGGELFHECNMKCVFCFTNCGTRNRGQKVITNKDVIDFLKNASQYAYDKNLFNYFLVSEGEPTLNPELTSMLREISSWGGTVTIFSNLLELSKEHLECFSEIKNLFVCGKMYGYSDNINDTLTGVPGSLKKMKENIMKLLELGLGQEGRLGVQCVVNSLNINECFDIYRWARSNSIVPHLMMFRAQGLGEKRLDLQIHPNEMLKLFKRCSRYDKEHYGYEWDAVLPIMVHGSCNIPGINLYLTTNGDYKYCACSDDVLGNVYKDSIESVLYSSYFEQVRQNGHCLMYVEEEK